MFYPSFWFICRLPSLRTLGSSIVGAGLSWWQATIVVWIAAGVSGMCMAFNSRAAASYHVGFPIILRTCFGMYGHYWPVLARGACAMLWVSILSKVPFFNAMLPLSIYVFYPKTSKVARSFPRCFGAFSAITGITFPRACLRLPAPLYNASSAS